MNLTLFLIKRQKKVLRSCCNQYPLVRPRQTYGDLTNTRLATTQPDLQYVRGLPRDVRLLLDSFEGFPLYIISFIPKKKLFRD